MSRYDSYLFLQTIYLFKRKSQKVFETFCIDEVRHVCSHALIMSTSKKILGFSDTTEDYKVMLV